MVVTEEREVPGRPEARSALIGPLTALACLAVWIGIFNVLGYARWGSGPLHFSLLVLAIALWGARRPIARLLPRWQHRFSTRSVRGVAIIACALYLAYLVGLHAWFFPKALGGPMYDIGRNSLTAAQHLFEHGDNPYRSPSQLGLNVSQAENVEFDLGRIRMFGVPYYYGYPYLPVMFLTYEPFRRVVGRDAIRVGNLALLLASIVGVAWLGLRLAEPGREALTAVFAVTALLGPLDLTHELYSRCVTDFVVSAFLLYGVIALSRERFVAGGVLVGLAQSAKFLPGGIFLVLLSAWALGREGGWRFVAAGAATVAGVVLPFVLWDPEAFLSATILYYVTVHAGGDSSSLWFFLPDALKGPFLLLGLLIVASLCLWTLVRYRSDLTLVVRMACLAWLVFCAFNVMTHLNYIWAIWAVASASFAIDLCRTTRTEDI